MRIARNSGKLLRHLARKEVVVELGRRLSQASAVLTSVVLAAAAALCVVAGLSVAATAGVVIGVGAILAVIALATAETTGATAAEPDLLTVLGRELERSRRHEQPLSVARLPLADRSNGAGAAGRYLALSVQASLRTIDDTIAEGDSLYLVLPGTDRESAERCVQRVAETRPGLFTDRDIRFGTFPEDGVTVAGILLVLDGAPPAAPPSDLPTLERRRVVVDLTARTPATSEVDA